MIVSFLQHPLRLLICASLLSTGIVTAQTTGPAGPHHADAGKQDTQMVANKHDAGTHVPGPAYDESNALALSQSAIGQSVGNYTFLDGNARQISMQSLRGKPVLVSLIYTSCYHICPTTTSNLADLVRMARDALGKDSFYVLTVGFDTRNDTPDRMRAFARQRGIDINDWYFVSASAETIHELTKDVGFSYFTSPKGFDHLIQLTMLDQDGIVYRQIYGMSPGLPSVVEPLKEIVWGKQVAATPIAGWINNVKLFCTVYDPTTGKYRFDYSPFIAFAIGVTILGALAWVIIRSWLGSRPSQPGT